MKISWHGHSCFKITTGEVTIVTDPFGNGLGLKPIRYQADIALVSHSHSSHNNVATIKGTPFVIDGPGEYDLRGVSIRGLSSFSDQKKGKSLNTIFVIKAEGLKVCHLGDLDQKELSGKQLEKLGLVDILMIPIGGVETINAENAVAIINQIEPKIVIPMHYKIPKLAIKLESVESFLKEIGTEKQEVDSLSIKRSTLKEEMQVVVMKVV